MAIELYADFPTVEDFLSRDRDSSASYDALLLPVELSCNSVAYASMCTVLQDPRFIVYAKERMPQVSGQLAEQELEAARFEASTSLDCGHPRRFRSVQGVIIPETVDLGDVAKRPDFSWIRYNDFTDNDSTAGNDTSDEDDSAAWQRAKRLLHNVPEYTLAISDLPAGGRPYLIGLTSEDQWYNAVYVIAGLEYNCAADILGLKLDSQGIGDVLGVTIGLNALEKNKREQVFAERLFALVSMLHYVKPEPLRIAAIDLAADPNIVTPSTVALSDFFASQNIVHEDHYTTRVDHYEQAAVSMACKHIANNGLASVEDAVAAIDKSAMREYVAAYILTTLKHEIAPNIEGDGDFFVLHRKYSRLLSGAPEMVATIIDRYDSAVEELRAYEGDQVLIRSSLKLAMDSYASVLENNQRTNNNAKTRQEK